MNKCFISSALQSKDRFKLYLLDSSKGNLQEHIIWLQSKNINVLNLGKSVAEYINTLEDYSYLNIDVYDYIKDLLDSNKSTINPSENRIVSIYNLGIMMEPRLELNPTKLLMEFSKSSALIILWEHKLEYSFRLNWPTQQNNVFLDFTDAQIKKLQYAI
jgi:hypothetical protein